MHVSVNFSIPGYYCHKGHETQAANLLPDLSKIKVHANINIQNAIYYSMLSQYVMNASWVILLNVQCDRVTF